MEVYDFSPRFAKPDVCTALSRCGLLIVLACATLTAWAQSFKLEASFPENCRGKACLSVFGDDTVPRTICAKIRDGKALFSGSVAKDSYAELHYQGASLSVPLFLENSSITVDVDVDSPESSHIVGSRSNSMLRYQLELCEGEDVADCLARYIVQNPSSPYAAYIICRYLSNDIEETSLLFSLLCGEATKTWHYRQLAQRLDIMKRLQPGNKIADFTFEGADKKNHKFSETICDTSLNLVMIASTWCEQCDRIAENTTANFSSINIIRIDIDLDKRGWDAPHIKQLDIEHIPHLLLLDKDGRIVANDIRHWQLEKLKIEK